MIKKWFLIRFSFLFLAFLNLDLCAWSMTPTIVSLDPNKPQTFFTVSSEKKEKPAAIEVTASKREINEKGEEILTDASNEFLIYPSQIILRENSTKSIRVVWKGDKNNLKEEKAYRIIATSLPVNVTKTENGEHAGEIGINIAVATRYLNSLYITPNKAKADVKCTKVYIEESQESQRRIVIELTNFGNAHQYLVDLSFTAENASQKFNVTKEMIQKNYPEGINILAQTKRNLYIPIEKND